MNAERRQLLATAAAAIAAARLGLDRGGGRSTGELASLESANAWLNSEPLTAAGLQGQVVLVSFWTYTCINWLRTQPYLRAWDEKYRDRGLVLIGVHSPEFGFEKDVANVRRASQSLGVIYPIAVDSGHRIWDGFANQYWPALYFVDSNGKIRDYHFGEGGYEKSENTIRQLLTKAGNELLPAGAVSVTGTGLEAPADWSSLRSPESYLGAQRRENAPEERLNHWTLSGDWVVGGEQVTLQRPGGKIGFRFHARDLHLVMGPGESAKPIPFRVRVDDQAPGPVHGLDIDDQGNGQVIEPRLYQLIKQHGPIVDRTFEIEFLDPGVQAFVFTFG